MKAVIGVALSIVIAAQAAAIPPSNPDWRPCPHALSVQADFTCQAIDVSGIAFRYSPPLRSIFRLAITFFGGEVLSWGWVGDEASKPPPGRLSRLVSLLFAGAVLVAVSWYSPDQYGRDAAWFKATFVQYSQAASVLSHYFSGTNEWRLREFKKAYEEFPNRYEGWIDRYGFDITIQMTWLLIHKGKYGDVTDPYGSIEDLEQIEKALLRNGYSPETIRKNILNRTLLLEAVRFEKEDPHGFGEDEHGATSVAVRQPLVDGVITKSKLFVDGPLPEPDDARMRLAQRYPDLVKLEHQYWTAFLHRRGRIEEVLARAPNADISPLLQPYEKDRTLIAKIQALDREIVQIKEMIARQHPEYAKSLLLPPPPQSPNFPLSGAIAAPGHRLPPLDVATINDGERMLMWGGRRTMGELRGDHNIMLVLCGDNPQIAVGAALNYLHRHFKPQLIVIAGAFEGPMVPNDWQEGEPKKFYDIMVAHGVPRDRIVMLNQVREQNGIQPAYGKSTYENVKFLKHAVDENLLDASSLNQLGVGGLTGKLTGIIVVQSLMVQQRAYLTVQQMFGLDNEHMESETPFYRDFYLAPPMPAEWMGKVDPNEWPYRLLIDGVREEHSILLYQRTFDPDTGRYEIDPNVVISPTTIQSGLITAQRLLNNVDIREEGGKSYIRQWQAELQRHVKLKDAIREMNDRDPAVRAQARSDASLIVTESRYDVNDMLDVKDEGNKVIDELYLPGSFEVQRVLWAIFQSAYDYDRNTNIGKAARWIIKERKITQPKIEKSNGAPGTPALPVFRDLLRAFGPAAAFAMGALSEGLLSGYAGHASHAAWLLALIALISAGVHLFKGVFVFHEGEFVPVSLRDVLSGKAAKQGISRSEFWRSYASALSLSLTSPAGALIALNSGASLPVTLLAAMVPHLTGNLLVTRLGTRPQVLWQGA